MPLNAAAAFVILPQLAAKAGEHPPVQVHDKVISIWAHDNYVTS